MKNRHVDRLAPIQKGCGGVKGVKGRGVLCKGVVGAEQAPRAFCWRRFCSCPVAPRPRRALRRPAHTLSLKQGAGKGVGAPVVGTEEEVLIYLLAFPKPPFLLTGVEGC